ncbi:hypothetical protein V4R08_09290 [Nitrobacter sp. NHB1]|uniref:hypothetical protein n=1 Tax=Nitrobacter sp. NHB1 TaxID=3119830 RepID=UPI002FFF7859
MSVIGFPLLLVPLAICNIIVFLMPGVLLTEPVVTLTLVSGVAWPVTLGDVLLALGILLLLFEVIKGFRAGGKYLTDHLLSLAVFGGAAAEFVMLPQFGSSTYFMLTLLSLVDFLSGVALRARRPARAVAVPPPSQGPPEAAAPESRSDPAPVSAPASVSSISSPAPAPAVATAAPMAESIPKSVPEPVIVHPETTADEQQPDIPAPDIQPGSGTPVSPDQPRR